MLADRLRLDDTHAAHRQQTVLDARRRGQLMLAWLWAVPLTVDRHVRLFRWTEAVESVTGVTCSSFIVVEPTELAIVCARTRPPARSSACAA